MAKGEKILRTMVLSDNLKSLLNKILEKGESDISSELLNIDNNDTFGFEITYVDVIDSAKDDSVSYIQTNRLKRAEDNGDDITDPWKMKGRTPMSVGRFVRRLFGDTFSQRGSEIFVNKFKSIIRIDRDFKNFELVKGNDIKKYYHHNKYNDQRGVLGGSCMKGGDAQTFFNIYVTNPNQVQLCILKSDKRDKIKGRAIIWKLSEPDFTFMDRIYTNEDADVNIFLEYAKQNGWAVKQRQSYRGDDLILPNGEKKSGVKLKAELENNNFNRYPYMDTMRYYYKDSNIISNSPVKKMGSVRTLNDTGGYYNEYDGDYEPVYVVDWRGNEILENDSVWCDLDEVNCLRSESIYVSKGKNGRGKHYIPDSKFLVYSDYSGSYYHKDDCIYSDYMKDWIYTKYAVEMYLDKEKTNSVWVHRLTLHVNMGKVGDDYFINSLLYRDQDENKELGDYHFIDDDFNNLPNSDHSDYFNNVPAGIKIDD